MMLPSITSERSSLASPPQLRRGSRRVHSRLTVEGDLSVIPVRLDRTPGEVSWASGCAVETDGSGLTFMVPRSELFPGRFIVIGLALDDSKPAFAMVRIKSQEPMDAELRVDACVVNNPKDDLLSAQQLTPHIDARNFGFRHGCSEDVLARWESLGVIRKYLVDRVLVCPDCGSIPTWRHACPKCGSARYRRSSLIHHFACAHVGHGDSFQSSDGEFRCPKCRATRLIAGTDYQYLSGPLTCFDCEESGCQPTLGCLCHRCLKRFEPAAATEQELYGYHVERLDLLDLVAACE